ncbi:MAG: hypothetical protein AB9M53_02700 [Leptothrix sp. (in: b-proteobacteria)]
MSAQKNPRGHDMLFVHAATVTALAKLLNPAVPYIWILGHMPHRYVQWWRTNVPLNDTDCISAQVRMLTYDIQVPTAEFLQRAAAFDCFGLSLVQAHKPMPDTLDLSRIPEEQQDAVLMKNGAFLRLWLPHAVETACVVCYEPGYLASTNG